MFFELKMLIAMLFVIYKGSEKLKKFMLGSLFTLLFNYCLGTTFILYKSIARKDTDKNDRNM